MSLSLASDTRRRLIAGWALSLGAAVTWKIFDAPVQRLLARQLPPEALPHLEHVVGWMVPLALLLPVLGLLWWAVRRG